MNRSVATLFLLFASLLFCACNVPIEPEVVLIAPTLETLSAEITPTTPPTTEATTIPQPTAEATASATEAPAQPTATIESVPTLLPTQIPTPVPSILDNDPQNWDDLSAWLFEARRSGMSAIDARQRLDNAGWMQDLSIFPGAEIAQDFREIDLSGDAKPEWIVAVKIKDSEQISTPRGFAYSGNAYIVADDTIVPYHAAPETDIDLGNTVTPSFLIGSLGDFTEDGINDVIFEQLNCGASFCYGSYRLMSYHHGYLQDVSDDRFSAWLSYPHLSTDGCGLDCQQQIRVSLWTGTGGIDGTRHTEIWQWDGAQLTSVGVELDVPDEREMLAYWIQQYYQYAETTFEVDLLPALLASGWVAEWEGEAASADFDGDGQLDWVLNIAEPGTMRIGGAGRSGDIWIVTAQGLFRFTETDALYDPTIDTLAFEILPDITGDGLVDILAVTEGCGAHTCTQGYRVLSYHNGYFENIVNSPETDGQFGGPSTQLTVIEFSGQPAIQIHGGLIGSAGAGIMRAQTNVWAWDGESLSYLDTLLDETNWQHHLLYEANKLTQSGHAGRIDAGIALYERVINDTALEIHNFFDEADQITSYDGVRQVAAFRLAYTQLRAGDVAAAQQHLNFLETTYPDAPTTLATAAMIAQINTGDDLSGGCAAAQTVFAAYENPLGSIEYQGYGNPSIAALELC
ncbi:MAG: hypothetical protein ACPG8W_19705 [Candidatus Promineifilaceae bacterium]